MGSVINLNGEILAPGEARVPAMDHGFLFGDSVYETLRTYGETPFLMDRHLARCENSASGVRLALPWDRRRTGEEVLRAVRAAGNRESLVRIVVTRGPGELDMGPRGTGPPNVLIYVVPHPVYPREAYERGVILALGGPRRSPSAGVDPTIKTGSRLANVLALDEARRRGAFEAVLLNDDGFLTEGTSSNLFLVRGGEVLTPEVREGLLPGITRQVVLEIAATEGVPLREGRLGVADLDSAEEVFITSTTKKVMPVHGVDARRYESPGPLTRRLMAAFERRVAEELSRRRERR